MTSWLYTHTPNLHMVPVLQLPVCPDHACDVDLYLWLGMWVSGNSENTYRGSGEVIYLDVRGKISCTELYVVITKIFGAHETFKLSNVYTAVRYTIFL